MAIIDGYYYPNEIFDSLNHFDISVDEIMETVTKKKSRSARDIAAQSLVIGDCAIAISFGTRTGGKTVGFGIKLIGRYLLFGERCLICCRTIKEKDKGFLSKWWGKILKVNDSNGIIQSFVKEHEIKFNNDNATCDGDIFSYCAALSDAYNVKDTGSFDRCTKMVIDEAMRPNERNLRIGKYNAMKLVWTIFQTMARGWDYALFESSIIFISNSTERDNWIFNDLSIFKFFYDNSKRVARNGIYVERVDNKIAKDTLDKSIIGQIMDQSMSGKSYKDESMNSTFADNDAFVKNMGLDFNLLRIQLVIYSDYLGVFELDNSLHIAKINPDKRSDKICNDPMFHTDDVSFSPKSPWNEALIDFYMSDSITFGSQQAKNLFLEYVGLI